MNEEKEELNFFFKKKTISKESIRVLIGRVNKYPTKM